MNRKQDNKTYEELVLEARESLAVHKRYSKEETASWSNEEILTELGCLHLSGMLVDDEETSGDLNLAWRYLKPAADKGHLTAIHLLGFLYRREDSGRGKNRHHSIRMSRKCFERCMKEGYAPSHLAMADMIANGQLDGGVEEVLEHIHYAWEHGDRELREGVTFELNMFAQVAVTVLRDKELAGAFFEKLLNEQKGSN